MDRRTLLKLTGAAGFLALPLSRRVFAQNRYEGSRYFFIVGDDRPAADRLLRRVADIAPDATRESHLTVLHMDRDREKLNELLRQFGPHTEAFSDPLLLRIPAPYTGDVETWTTDWLQAFEGKVLTDACYPVSDSWWSVDGDWNPTAQKVRDHLFESDNHTDGHFEEEWLALLKRPELQSIHSDHHREMIGEGSVYWDQVNAECLGLSRASDHR